MTHSTKARPTLTAAAMITLVAVASATLAPRPAIADEGAAFMGGLIGGHVLTNMANQSERRTRAAEQQAYQQRQQQQAPAQPQQPSVEERLNTLDRLAANGMITKEEYDRRRKAIIDGI